MIKVDAIEKILVNLVLTARANIPGASGKEQEDWIADHLERQVERADDLIPGLKAYVDLPFVDALQRQGERFVIQFAIRKAYAYAIAHGELPSEKPKKEAAPELNEDEKKVAEALGVSASEITRPVQPTEQAKPTQEQAQQPEVPTPDEADEPDYEGLLGEYGGEGGWYTFPGKDGGPEVKQQGREKAIEYLKTREDLVYEDVGGEDAASQSN